MILRYVVDCNLIEGPQKVRKSLRRFSRVLQMFNSILCKPLIPIFNEIEQEV